MCEQQAKLCARSECSAPVVRHEGETPNKFAKRKYCSHECGYADKRAPASSKTCKRTGCANILTRRRGEGPKRWEKRQYCSHVCQCMQVHGAHGDVRPEKPCARPGCPEKIIKAKGSSASEFAKRKYCSAACDVAVKRAAGEAKRKAKPERRPTSPRSAPRLTKPCKLPTCQNQVVQRAEEGRNHFEARRYCCSACREVARRSPKDTASTERPKPRRALAPKPTGPRPKGNRQPRDTPFASEFYSAHLEAVVRRLRRLGAVYPLSAETNPYAPPNGDDERWYVLGRVMSVEEMIARAARA
jgi:hypothetical protein